MKKIILVLVLVGFQELYAQNIELVKVTDVMEEIKQKDDTTRIVNLWATWCAPCVKELPYFEEINQSYQDKKVKVILVAVEDTEEKVRRFVEKKQLKAVVWLLDETDANYWIPEINDDWQGDIPVTRAVNEAQGLDVFHRGEITPEELKQLVEKSLN